MVGTDGETHIMTVHSRSASSVTSALYGTGMAEFQIISTVCTPLQNGMPGATCDVTIRFHPTTRGAETATLVVNASPSDAATASLTGTGQAP